MGEKGDKPTDKAHSLERKSMPTPILAPTPAVDLLVEVPSPTYSSSSSPAPSLESSPASSPRSSMSSPSLESSPFGEEFAAPDSISPADASFLREFFDFELPPLDIGWNNFGTEWCSFV